ncbi:MAG: ATP-binding cassette domain-containing protein, partial [Chloroflexota bacterium]
AIEGLKEVIQALKAAGHTILIAEHRLYYLIEICDRVVYMADGSIKGSYTRDEFVTIRDSERQEMGLRAVQEPRLAEAQPEVNKPDTGAAAPVLEIEALKCYRNRQLTVDIERIRLPKHRVIALVGHNGAGKSTFAAGFCGTMRSTANIKDGASLSRRERLKRAYMVMQDVNHQLFAESVLDELMIGNDIDDTEKVAAADALLDSLNLLPYRDEHPHALSGGQKQRTSIATALFTDKRYLIFDEPTSGVDLVHMQQIGHLIQSIKEQVDLIIVITHDIEFINSCCDELIRLENGRIVEQVALN